jgi:hypothetical protein
MTWALPPLSLEMTHCWNEPAGALDPAELASDVTGPAAADGWDTAGAGGR